MDSEQPKIVRLTDSNIISSDVNGSSVYGLLQHPVFTEGECVLGFFDMNELSGGNSKEGKCSEVVLKQIYKFDEDVRHNIMIAANATSVVVLHGRVFDPSAKICEMIIKKKTRGPLKISNITKIQN